MLNLIPFSQKSQVLQALWFWKPQKMFAFSGLQEPDALQTFLWKLKCLYSRGPRHTLWGAHYIRPVASAHGQKSLRSISVPFPSGWWFQPSWKILVNGKDNPIYYGKKKCSKPPISLVFLPKQLLDAFCEHLRTCQYQSRSNNPLVY